MRSFFQLLALIITVGVSFGCGGDPSNQGDFGKMAVALTGTNGYTADLQLTLDPAGAGDDVVLSSTEGDGETALTAVLPEDSYGLTLDSVTLYKNGTPVNAASVTHLGFSANPVVVTAGSTTNVDVEFRVGDESVSLTFGATAFVLDVEEGACIPSCAAGTACRSPNGGAASCLTDFVPTTWTAEAEKAASTAPAWHLPPPRASQPAWSAISKTTLTP